MSSQIFHTSPVKFAPSASPSPPPLPIASLPIVAISIAGILAASFLLLSYYVFVMKCCLNTHHSSRRRQSPSLSSASEQRGLAESTIRAIPTFRYRQLSVGAAECAVCLSEFQEQERIRLLPSCLHVFHIDCIDTWLQFNANCPLCRASITAPPVPFNPLAMALAPQFSHPRDAFLEIRDEERKMELFGSRGDECIYARKKEEEKLCLQPMRRSFSVDSSGDMQLHVALQRILQQSSHEGSSSGGGRFRRSLLSFGWNSRNSVLPLQMEL
ncbi:RING-H2 finger protein ATL1-like [Curcuma longa]|uniref:RING-H2 finger protein ATL1-like n=1 Tax=Curcuma longa TaxID=136217 RepID=UPI003D9F9BBE